MTEIAIKLSEDFEDWKFNKDLEQYLGDKMFRIILITRKILWNIDSYLDNGLLVYTRRTFGEDIIYHLKVAKDTTYKDVFLEQMSIKKRE